MNIKGVFLALFTVVEGTTFGENATISDETLAAYSFGVDAGIINPMKYPLELFTQHDRNIFRHIYHEYITLFDEHNSTSYQDWLVLNNYGLMPDTQESLFKEKSFARSHVNFYNEDDEDYYDDVDDDDYEDYEKPFLQKVKTGDILISGKSRGGLVGHAALMTSDYWVLEMRGGSQWKKCIRDNNRQLSKKKWYRKYKSDWTTVYRCPDKKAAERAALWADRNYFNPYGGQYKTIQVKYKITNDFLSTNPSYSSKMVLQSYYFTTPGIIRDPAVYSPVIIPANIPAYFLEPYKLLKIGKF